MGFGSFLVGLLLGYRKKIWKNHKKLIRRGLAGVILLLLINFIVSCYYYKASTTFQPSTAELIHLSDLGKRFVVHQDYNARFVTSLIFDTDSLELTLGPAYYHSGLDITPISPNTVKRYKPKKGDARLLNEVHLYIDSRVRTNTDVWKVAHSDLERIDLYNHSTKYTTRYSILFGIALIPAAFVAVTLLALLIALLTGSSCPFIYTFNGEEFVFAGEIYSGAVYPPLERHDYLLLPNLVEEDRSFSLKISNQLDEIQHTNLLELLVFDHPADVNVLVDKYGQPHSISESRMPVSAVNLKGADILKIIEKEDDLIYIGDDPSKDPPLLDGVILTFEVPVDIKKVDLVIKAKNSYWLDYVYQNFREMLGASYNLWMKKQQEGDPQKMKDWSLSQNIPLSVFLYVDGEWEFMDYFNTAGPMAFKKDILSLDISERGDGPVQIKLEAGSYFWEIGYTELGFGNDPEFHLETVKLQRAISETGDDVFEELEIDDEQYYIQPEIGNEATLTFPVPERIGEARTVVLHSKGYYDIIANPEGTPKVKALKEIRKSGNFNVYSNELMQDMLAEHMIQNGRMEKNRK